MRLGRAAGPRLDPTGPRLATTEEPSSPPVWVQVVEPGPATPSTVRMSWRPVVIEISIAALVVFVLVAGAGVLGAYQVAQREAVTNALRACDVIARSAVEPALSDALVSSSTDTPAAIDQVDRVVRSEVLSSTVIRVNLWTPDGRVVYSDDTSLIGQRFDLDDSAQQAMRTRTTIGAVVAPTAPQNVDEPATGKVLEIYRPVRTPSGQPLLFETDSRYDVVIAHSGQMWLYISLIAAGSLLLMHMLWVPLSWVLVSRLRQALRQRDLLLDRALSASAEERRRIAGTLHDGVVQDLAATSFVVAGSAQQAHRAAQAQLAERLETAAAGVRASIGALRSLLVDIYPPNLRVAGLSATLADLATSLETRGMHVVVAEDADLDLDPPTQTLIYRVAQECLRNADRHGQATNATVRIRRRDDRVRLDVVDDGVGFDAVAMLASPGEGHFGLRVMRDLAAEHGAELAVVSQPGVGTQWRLEVSVASR
jgi:signal transduction histidine kinase